MTTEEIIQRLLDEKHITVKEAMQMLKDLVKNEVFIPMFPNQKQKYPMPPPPVTIYGVNYMSYDEVDYTTSTTTTTIANLENPDTSSSDKTKEE